MRQNQGEKVTMGMQSVWDHIRLAAERTPDNIALVDDRSDRQLTFAELVEDVEAAAAGLGAAGAETRTESGDHAAERAGTRDRDPGAAPGTVVCMINPRLKPEEAVRMLIADAGMAGAVCVADLPSLLLHAMHCPLMRQC